MYSKSLELRKIVFKSTAKTTKKSSSQFGNDCSSEIDLKFQMYQCQRKLLQATNAIATLESIPARQRTAKINYALGELYQKERLDPSAIIAYKEILKENPLALNVIIKLLKLGVKAQEIINMVTCNLTSIPNTDWLHVWIKGQASLYTTDSSDAVASFRRLLAKPFLRDNSDVLSSLAEAHYYNGDYKKCLTLFRKVFNGDIYFLRGMDIFAACLAKENYVKELEHLANRLISRCEANERSSEPWVVLAYFSYLTNKKESKALYFTQKACLLSNNSVESLLLKGKIMAEAKQSQVEAVTYFFEAFNTAPYRFEAVRALTEAYCAGELR